MMFFEVIQSRVIVLPSGHNLCQVEQFEILCLEVELRTHQVVAIPLVSLRELNLVDLILNH
jgi:hypothetical protein